MSEVKIEDKDAPLLPSAQRDKLHQILPEASVVMGRACLHPAFFGGDAKLSRFLGIWNLRLDQ